MCKRQRDPESVETLGDVLVVFSCVFNGWNSKGGGVLVYDDQGLDSVRSLTDEDEYMGIFTYTHYSCRFVFLFDHPHVLLEHSA